MPAVDIEYDGTRNQWDPENLFNIPRTEPFFVATEKVLPWKAPADGDASRAVVPGAFLERLLRRTRVPDPTVLQPDKFMERTLADTFVGESLGLLVEEGLLEPDEDAPAGDTVHVFESATELQRKADQCAEQLAANGTLVIEDGTEFDTFELVTRALA